LFETPGKKNPELYCVFLPACSMHFSHFMFVLALLLVVLLCRRFFGLGKNAYQQMAILLGLGLIGIIPGASALSKSKHVFFFGAMVEHGIVKEYLDEHCSEKNYRLCAYKDSLPSRAYVFIWDKKSPFYKIGGWKQSKTEFNTIIYGSLTEPKYIWLHIKASALATCEQLLHFRIADGMGSFKEKTPLFERLQTYSPHDINLYRQSGQYRQTLETITNAWNILIALTMALSMAALMAVAWFHRSMKKNIVRPAMLLFAGILINAWNNGTFANAIDRLGAKMMWMIPLAAFLLLADLYIKKAALLKQQNG
jgi:hypothetical protein